MKNCTRKGKEKRKGGSSCALAKKMFLFFKEEPPPRAGGSRLRGGRERVPGEKRKRSFEGVLFVKRGVGERKK